MDASAKKSFQVKVRCLVRMLKEYKNYKNEVNGYDLNVVSQDKKKQEFYLESKSALDQVEKKLVEYYHTLNVYMVPPTSFRMKTWL
jgi:protein subunit release factor A